MSLYLEASLQGFDGVAQGPATEVFDRGYGCTDVRYERTGAPRGPHHTLSTVSLMWRQWTGYMYRILWALALAEQTPCSEPEGRGVQYRMVHAW